MADLAYPSVAFPVDNLMLACRNRTQWDSVKSPYFRCATGGQSWAVPQRAGLFALAREANPSITKEQVDALLVQTARSVAFAPDIHLAVRDIAAFAEKLAPKTPKPQARRVSPPVPAALT